MSASADVYIDGGGVLPDQPLPHGTRLRFRLSGDAGRDLTAYVEGGRLHVTGFRYPVAVEPRTPAHLAITTVALGQ